MSGPEAQISVSAKQLIATANSLLEAANHLQPSSSLTSSSRPGSVVNQGIDVGVS